MKSKFKKISALAFFFTFAVVGYYLVSNSEKFYLFQAVQAVGGFSYQIGLTNVVITPCVTTGTPPVCSGGTLCYVKDPATCLDYSDVSGSMAGGMGMNALFRKDATIQSGLTPGGQLIAGGMSPTLMDSGVLASAGGCSGCLAKANKIDKIKEVVDFAIASFSSILKK